MKAIINNTAKVEQETIIVGVPEHLNQLEAIKIGEEDLKDLLSPLKEHQVFSTNVGTISTTFFKVEEKAHKLITVGLGNTKELGYNDYLKIFGNLFQALNSSRITEASLLFNSFKSQKVEKEIIAEILGQQSEQSIYHFDGYKTNKSAPYQLTLEIHTEEDDIAKSIENGEAIATAVNLARDYGNIPPNILTPAYYAELIENQFNDTNVFVDIKDDETLQKEGFGLIHAVGKGSKNGPRVITLTYNGGKPGENPIALVGKGITYDSGGYSIKSKTGMQTMKFDMCGAANIVGMIDAISRLQLPINIVGVIASAENMISSNAMKPDDVLTALSGETVEMLNSDAEGRLVLGDAVFYANQFQPKIILDFATLTGAAVAALGEDKAALFNSNADKEIEEIRVSAKEMEEYAFELPMTQTEQRLIRQSDVADLVNHTNGHGKALFAATFITHFSGSTPHIHFDIAGPATTNKTSYKGPKGPTGSMITTVLNWLR